MQADLFTTPDPHQETFARPGQPCSTDEFLERLYMADYDKDNTDFHIHQWLSGNFTAAMEGL